MSVATVIPAKLRSNENPLAPGEINRGASPMQQMLPSVQSASSAEGTSSALQPIQSVLGPPKLFTQVEFRDLVRDANLTRKSAEAVASRFKQRNLVTADFRITADRKHKNTKMLDE